MKSVKLWRIEIQSELVISTTSAQSTCYMYHVQNLALNALFLTKGLHKLYQGLCDHYSYFKWLEQKWQKNLLICCGTCSQFPFHKLLSFSCGPNQTAVHDKYTFQYVTIKKEQKIASHSGWLKDSNFCHFLYFQVFFNK